jgi:hypothetical protein
MTFFNFQEDQFGNQQFQVSERWWWFLAATIPLTIAVFAVWLAWQKFRFKKFEEEEFHSNLLESQIGTEMADLRYGESGRSSPGILAADSARRT